MKRLFQNDKDRGTIMIPTEFSCGRRTVVSWFNKAEGFSKMIRRMFKEEDNHDSEHFTMNWLFLSTSGTHGSYGTLDDAEEESEDPFYITALVVQPRIMNLHYGNGLFYKKEISWLRSVVKKTLGGVQLSQQGNIPELNNEHSGHSNEQEEKSKSPKKRKRKQEKDGEQFHQSKAKRNKETGEPPQKKRKTE